MVRKLQPGAVIFSDAGPDVRWVGNESGYAGDPCWSTYTPHGPKAGVAPAPGLTAYKEGENGHVDGEKWIPAECDVSIRPGWFWHEKEDDKVKTPEQLKELYFKSVGRGASFLLNVPPDRRGRIHPNDEKSLLGFKKLLDEAFAKDLAHGAKATASSGVSGSPAKHVVDGDRDSFWRSAPGSDPRELVLSFEKPVEFDTLRIREAIQFGQRVRKVTVSGWSKGRWDELASVQSVGNCRLIQIEPFRTTKLRFSIEGDHVALSEIGLFLDPNEAP